MKENSKKGESRSIEILYFYTFWKTVLVGEISKIKRVQSIEECLLNIGTLIKEPKQRDKHKTEINSDFEELFQSELERLRDEASTQKISI